MYKYSTRCTDWGLYLGGISGALTAALGSILLAESWGAHGLMAVRILIITVLIGVPIGAVIGGLLGGLIDAILDRRRSG